ncbi:MAG: sensor signal transduction histidine kinase [Marmoricola sp.]|nr:sensor signal transduction histidine kinase [Marmoricola sp.]
MRWATLAALYVVAGVLGRMTIIDGRAMSLAWPAAGVGAIWLATSDRRRIATDLGLLAVVVWVVNASTGASPSLALLFVSTNLIQAIVFVWLVRWWRPDLDRFGGHRQLGSLADLGALAGAALLGCGIAAGVGTAGLGVLVGPSPDRLSDYLVWTGRNVAGIVVVGTLGLLLLGRLAGATDRADVLARLRATFLPSARVAVEAVALTLVSATLLWTVFGTSDALPVGFLLLFTAVLAGVRMGPVGVVVHGLGLGAGALVFTLHGRGPFAAIGSMADRALVAQVFVTMLIVTGLVLALNRAERDRALCDLSELQRATQERALLFGAVLDHMREGIAVVDGSGRYVLRNPAGRRMVARGRGAGEETPIGVDESGQAVGMTHLDGSVVRPEEMPFRRALNGEDVIGDYLLTPAGSTEPIVLEVTAAPLPLVPGEAAPVAGAAYDRAIVSYRDVTALRHDRDALATFAGVAAHDLKRPLSVINGWSEALQESFAAGPVGQEEGTRVLARVTSAAQQMGNFIDDLLSYTVVRDAPVHAVDVDLSREADDSAAVFRERGSRPQIYVQSGLHVTADPVLVRQVLDNLIGNATKYVAPGVRPRVQVRGREDAEETVVTISDNGIGIPEEHRERVFETFHRAHGESYRGTGLGLAIVRRAVERCNGSITLRDNPGGGTVFEVRLPAGTPAETPAAPVTAPAAVAPVTPGTSVAAVAPVPSSRSTGTPAVGGLTSVAPTTTGRPAQVPAAG